MLDRDNGDISTWKLVQIKAKQFYTDLGLYQQC